MTDTTTQAVTALVDGVTPGPWADDTPTHFGENARVSGPDGRLICEVGNATHDQDEFDANARFIAAARDLVPALMAERDKAQTNYAATWQANLRLVKERDALAAQLAAAETRARESALQALAAYGQAAEAHEAQLAAEAKLATARGEALEEAARVVDAQEAKAKAASDSADDETQTDWDGGILFGTEIGARMIAAAIRALAKGGT